MSLLILTLMASFSTFADFVYMKENPNGKSIELFDGTATTSVNDLLNGQWSLYPDLSADGKSVVYVEGPDGNNLHLTLQDKKSGVTFRFHHPYPGMVLHPKFSKNGKYLFYTAPNGENKNSIYYFDYLQEVKNQGNYLYDYTIRDPQPLNQGEEAYFPRPSSDGAFVVYQRNSLGKKEIVLFDRIENKKTVLALGMSPALSFDERLIAYTSKKDGNWNIYVIDRHTGAVTQMTSDSADEMAPTFRPNHNLAFASNKSGTFRLYQLNHHQTWTPLTQDNDLKTSHYSPQFSGEKNFEQSELAPFIGNARSSFGTVFHQGLLYMAGGHQGKEHTYPPESFSDQFLVYQPETNQWQELAPRPRQAHGYQLAAYQNYLYAFGGFAYSPDHKPRWKSLAAIDRYDIRNNKWETIGELNAPRSSNVALTVDHQVYIAGGWDSTPQKENDAEGRFHDSIEVFDLKTETLKVADFKLPLPLRRALTGVSYQGKLILIGGLGVGASHFELLGHVTSIDPNDGKSRELAPLPFATFAPSAGVIDDELFVFGGMFRTGPMNFEYVSHIYAMNLKQQSWRHTGRYVMETKGFSQVFNLNQKKLGILGGHHYLEGFDSPVTTFETFSKKL